MGPTAMQLVLIKGRYLDIDNYGVKIMWQHIRKTAFSKSKREGSEETNSGDTLISDFKPPEL